MKIARPDPARWRADFPILAEQVHGKPLCYLDSAATTQKPRAVIEATSRYYAHDNANVHRAVYALGERATQAYEGARRTAQHFLNAADPREIIFVRGTTEAVNLVAQAYARPRLQPGDEILVTWLEHHSNIVPWQLVAEQTGAKVVPVPVTDDGDVDLDAFARLLGPRTRLAAFTHVSNALGTVNPVEAMVALCRDRGVPTLIDGAQAVQHGRVDVQALGCDFYAFSGHKAYGPTGIGVLYGRAERLNEMVPYQGGGDMIRRVSFAGTSYADIPSKFEAGTPNIAGAAGLGAALSYLQGLGLDAIAEHERRLLAYAVEALDAVPGLRIIGRPAERAGVVSFVLDGVHPHDTATILDHEGVAVRAGHHCAQPLMERFGVSATTRCSVGLYNDEGDIDTLVAGLRRVMKMFSA